MVEITQIVADAACTRIQGLVRRALVRERVYRQLSESWEKIFDPVQQIYYYYNTSTDEAAWKRPAPLLWRDLGDVAPTFTDEQAAIYVQCAWRRLMFLRTVRRVVASVVSKVYDENSGNYYYYNAQTGRTSWTKPLLLGSQDIEVGTQRLINDEGLVLAENAAVELVDSDDESRESQGSAPSRRRKLSEDSLGLMLREYPRSSAQRRVDLAEDTEGTESLDLSGLEMSRISFRALSIETLTALNVSDNQITRLVPDIGGLAMLEKLDASGNQLRSLPKELEELEELKWFSVARNRIKWFPGNVYRLVALEHFDLSENLLRELPVQVGDLELLQATRVWAVGPGMLGALTHLDVSKNQLTKWPNQLDQLSSLETLDVSRNSLSVMAPCRIAQSADQDKHEGIGEPDLQGCTWAKLASLKTLDLSHNAIKLLPDDLAKVTSLTSIDARHNALVELPANLELTQCATFLLDDNKLNELHDGFAAGLAKKLDCISCRNNDITSTSTRIGDMRQVKSVWLEGNGLEVLDKSITQLRLLELLSLKNNKLTVTPTGFATMFRLKTLDLSMNLFEALDEKAIESLVSLTALDVSHNSIRNFPQRLGRLNKLQSLDYSHNSLTLLPQNCFKGCNDLYSLKLHGNKLTAKGLEAGRLEAVPSLELLTLDFNQLDSLPDALADLPQLRSLTFSHNPCCARPEECLDPFWGLRDRCASVHVGAARFDEPVEVDVEDSSRDARKARRLLVLQGSSRGTELLERGEPLDAVEPLARASEKHARLLVDEPGTASFSHHFHLGAAYVARARGRKVLADKERRRQRDEEERRETARRLVEKKQIARGIFPEDAAAEEAELNENSLARSSRVSLDSLSLSRRDFASPVEKRGPGVLVTTLSKKVTKDDAAVQADLVKARLALDEAMRIDIDLRREDGDIEGADNTAFRDPSNAAVEILHARGSAHLRRGDAKLAVADLDQAILARKNHAPSLALRCRARLELGQFPQASRDCTKAWRIELRRHGLWPGPPEGFDLDNLHRDVVKVLEPLDLIFLRKEIDRGVQCVQLLKCDIPENDRVYLQTAEGLCYRRRNEIQTLDVEGRSKRRRWLARRKAEHDAIEKAEIDRSADEDKVISDSHLLIDRSKAELAWRRARYDLEIIEERRRKERDIRERAAEIERVKQEEAQAREVFEMCQMAENEMRAVWVALDAAAKVEAARAAAEQSAQIKKAAMDKKKNMGKRKTAKKRPGRR